MACACWVWLGWAVAAQARNQPPPPASRPALYDPDPSTCQAASIRQGFARQLEPFADQSEAVLRHLRKVQLELTVASLRRCVTKGLMDEPTARSLAAELVNTSGAAQIPVPSTRP